MFHAWEPYVLALIVASNKGTAMYISQRFKLTGISAPLVLSHIPYNSCSTAKIDKVFYLAFEAVNILLANVFPIDS
jgi:hypothetical protein